MKENSEPKFTIDANEEDRRERLNGVTATDPPSDERDKYDIYVAAGGNTKTLYIWQIKLAELREKEGGIPTIIGINSCFQQCKFPNVIYCVNFHHFLLEGEKNVQTSEELILLVGYQDNEKPLAIINYTREKKVKGKIKDLPQDIVKFPVRNMHEDGVRCMDIFTYKEVTYLVTGSKDYTAKIWDLEKCTCVDTLEGHDGWVFSLKAFLQKENKDAKEDVAMIVTGSYDKTAILWKFDGMKCVKIKHFNDQHGFSLSAVCVTPDKQALVSITLANIKSQ